MLSLVKLQKNHIQSIDTDFDFWKSSRDVMCEHPLNGYTALLNDIPIALGGVYKMWDGVAEGWFIVGKHGKNFPIKLARTVRFMAKKMINDNKLVRLQASVCLNDKKALRFIKWLNFKEEGIMRKFGPDGVDYMRYAWVKA